MATHDDLLVLTDRQALDHDPGEDHPESPARLRSIIEALSRLDDAGWRLQSPTPASREQLERVHTPAYLDTLNDCRGRAVALDEDTRTSAASVDLAELAAGAAINAVDAVLAGACRNAFVMMRPPGHHAEAARAMGFCLLGSLAIGTAHALTRSEVSRVMVIDWDVHHGNGTHHIFEDRCEVLVVDLHQSPLWPGTGAADEIGHGAGAGFTANVPMPAGCGDDEYIAVMHDLVAPLARAWRPDLILVAAGFDAHEADPLGSMNVTAAGFGALCAHVRHLAESLCDGRLVLHLEGGYDLAALVSSTLACIDVLRAPVCPAVRPASGPSPHLHATIEHLSAYWSDLGLSTR